MYRDSISRQPREKDPATGILIPQVASVTTLHGDRTRRHRYDDNLGSCGIHATTPSLSFFRDLVQTHARDGARKLDQVVGTTDEQCRAVQSLQASEIAEGERLLVFCRELRTAAEWVVSP